MLDDQTGSEYFEQRFGRDVVDTASGLVPPTMEGGIIRKDGDLKKPPTLGNLHSASTHTRSGSVQSAESADGLRTAQPARRTLAVEETSARKIKVQELPTRQQVSPRRATAPVATKKAAMKSALTAQLLPRQMQ